MMAITIFIWFPILFIRGTAASPDRHPNTRWITRVTIPYQMPCQSALPRKFSRYGMHPALTDGKLSIFCAERVDILAHFSSLMFSAPPVTAARSGPQAGTPIKKGPGKPGPEVGMELHPDGILGKSNQPFVNSG
jgi:hypothetical protein